MAARKRLRTNDSSLHRLPDDLACVHESTKRVGNADVYEECNRKQGRTTFSLRTTTRPWLSKVILEGKFFAHGSSFEVSHFTPSNDLYNAGMRCFANPYSMGCTGSRFIKHAKNHLVDD